MLKLRGVIRRFQATSASKTTKRNQRLFDRDLKNSQKIHSIKQPEFAETAYLHERTANLLADRVADIKRNFKNVLEIGSAATCGQITTHLATMAPGCVENLTLSAPDKVSKDMIEFNLPYYEEEFSDVPEDFPGIKEVKILKDEENDLKDIRMNTYDLVVFSSGVHWCNNLDTVFKHISRILKPDGALLVAMAGGETLAELRTAIPLAEQERNGRVVSRFSPLARGDDLSSLLSSAGFNLITCDIERIQVSYPTALELMQDLKHMGEQNASINRYPMSFDTVLSIMGIYSSMYRKSINENVKYAGHLQTSQDKSELIAEHFEHDDNVREMQQEEIFYGDIVQDESVVATFDILHGIAWNPDASQQKPSARGSAPKGFQIHKDNPK